MLSRQLRTPVSSMEIRLRTHDGVELLLRSDRPAAIKAQVLLVHGLGDHGEGLPYRWLCEALLARGIAVHRPDLRGHGRSGGPSMHVPAWARLREDLLLLRERIAQSDPDPPLFLVGISLGGLIALDLALQSPSRFKGVVALAAATDPGGVSPLVRTVAPLLGRLLPRLRLDPGLDLRYVSRDEAAAREYLADPQFQIRCSARLAAEVLAGMAAVDAAAPRLRLPLLLAHGSDDAIVPASGSQRFLARAGSADKRLRLYTGARHNLLLETNRAEVQDDIADWLLAHAS